MIPIIPEGEVPVRGDEGVTMADMRRGVIGHIVEG